MGILLIKQQESERGFSLYKKLVWRNRFIAILRLFFPIAGLAIFAFLIFQIIIANISKEYGISSVKITRDSITIKTPKYEGVMNNGTSYKITAQSAITTIGNSDEFNLNDAIFDMVRIDGYEMEAKAKQAYYDIAAQTLKVAGEMEINDSRNIKTKLTNTLIEWDKQSLYTKDNVEIIFADGSILNAKTLNYDSEKQISIFGDVTLIILDKE
jgi:hypothetical protein